MSYSTTSTSHLPAEVILYLTLADAATGYAAPTGQLHLDCSAVPYRRTSGVCHQVSQLLHLRRAGASIQLYQVHPVLRHCLHQLQVAHLFAWAA